MLNYVTFGFVIEFAVGKSKRHLEQFPFKPVQNSRVKFKSTHVALITDNKANSITEQMSFRVNNFKSAVEKGFELIPMWWEFAF